MSAGRCAAAGCGRFVPAGSAWCGRHDRIDEATTGADLADHPPVPSFRERLRAGEYEGLGDAGIAAAIAAAAQSPGLGDEIGVVRLALARLLDEEADASRCAAGVARLVAVAVRAALAQQALGGAPGAWRALLERALPGPDDADDGDPPGGEEEGATDGEDDDPALAGGDGAPGFGAADGL